MNAEERAIFERADQMAREITDRDWLEAGVSQEELDRGRLEIQEFYAALSPGESFDEAWDRWDCRASAEVPEQEAPAQSLYQANADEIGQRQNGDREPRLPTLIEAPAVIEAVGNKPKRIEEYVGRVNSQTAAVSVARMVSPAGWVEPGQTPDFDEYTVVLRGLLQVTTRGGILNVRAGQAVIAHRGEWVQYSSPESEGAEYIAVCLPAFAPDSVHRDA